MSHSVKQRCPRCGAADWYRHPHRLWLQAFVRHPIHGQRPRVLAAAPVHVMRCRACGIAFHVAPAGGRHRLSFLLPVGSATPEAPR